MIEISTYIIFLAAIQVVAITPGPVWFHLLSKLPHKNPSVISAVIFGNALGIATHIALAYFGLSVILQNSATAYDAIRIVGGLYLIYLAIKVFRKRDLLPTEVPESDGKKQKPIHKEVLQAYLINLLNPKVITFIVSFFPQFIDISLANVGIQYIIYGFTYVLNASLFLILLAKFYYRIIERSANIDILNKSIRYISFIVLSLFGGKSIYSAFVK